MKTIVVGVDGSATSKIALEHAASVATAMGARLHLVNAYQTPKMLMASAADPMFAGMAVTGPDVESELVSAGEEILRAAADGLRARGLEVETTCVPDDPASALIDVAETQRADLIVVGNKGMRGTKRFLLGSVPNRVAHHAPCSVTIVRTT